MAVNKVEANGETLIDLTNDTVTADTLVEGRTAHLASGEQVTGAFKPVTGVKGNAETTYRAGNVNLTPANIGLGNVNSQINYNTNNGVKNLIDPEWFTTYGSGAGTVESYDTKTGSVTGFASASQTGAYIGVNISTNQCNQFLEDGKTYILSWTVDSRTNDGIFGFRRADNNAFSVGGSATINRTGNYSVTYTHNASIPVFFSFCINIVGTSSDKRIAISNLMLREATIEDDTFVPYAKSNAELTSGKLDATGNESTPYDNLPDHFELETQSGVLHDPNTMFIKMKSDPSSNHSYLLLGNDDNIQYFGIEYDYFTVMTKGAISSYKFKDDGIYLNGTRIAP